MKKNKGAAGVDGISFDEMPERLREQGEESCQADRPTGMLGMYLQAVEHQVGLNRHFRRLHGGQSVFQVEAGASPCRID